MQIKLAFLYRSGLTLQRDIQMGIRMQMLEKKRSCASKNGVGECQCLHLKVRFSDALPLLFFRECMVSNGILMDFNLHDLL